VNVMPPGVPGWLSANAMASRLYAAGTCETRSTVDPLSKLCQ
jgi:hypothetical protein